MENLSVIILVVSAFCAAASAQENGPCFDTSSLSDTVSNSGPVSNTSCTCSASSFMNYDESTCDLSCEMDIATYRVEFNASNAICSTYFDDENIAKWTVNVFTHNSSCNVTQGPCNEATIDECVHAMGWNGTLDVNVTKEYPYASVIIEYGDMDSEMLTIGASRLLQCNGSGWLQNFTVCPDYFALVNESTSICGQCGSVYNFGCFEFTLTSTCPDANTSSPTSSMGTSSEATETPTTTAMTTGTSSGSHVAHSLGLTMFLLMLLRLFRATLP